MPRSLSVRLLILLTVALLPLGLVAVYQTLSVIRKAEVLAQRDILASTSEAASAQIGLIRQAHGAAYAIGALAIELGPGSPECQAVVARFIEDDPRFVFAGFIRTDGRMICSSNGEVVDFSGSSNWASVMSDPRPTVTVNRQGQATGLSVVNASVPVFAADGELAGVASVSIPHSLSDLIFDRNIEGLEVAIVAADGQILSASTGIDQSSSFDALRIIPASLTIPNRGLTIDAAGEAGVATVSVVPLVPGETYVVGKWADSSGPISGSVVGSATPLFPVIMWAAGLFVAFFALNSLVLRHLKNLRRHMRGFSVNDLTDSYVRLDGAPSEIGEIADSYNALLDRIKRDRADLSESVREKEILLKEVHHRVKNNLQLIASILNMQLRAIASEDAKNVLRRVQDRVMSLATIHKLLYAETQVEFVRADILLTEIINSAVNVGSARESALETRISLEPIDLDPDRAVPLSLLVTEAVTNALKNVGTGKDQERYIEVNLKQPTPGIVELGIVNSCAPAGRETEEGSHSGLGTRLIDAFVAQLGGSIVTQHEERRYSLHVRFPTSGGQLESDEAA